jgi:uncharacterized membrane protein
MTRRYRRLKFDLLVVILICGVLGAADDIVMRSFASIPLVFFLPGSALLRALRWEAPMPYHRRIYEVGLSIAVTILSGFFLNAVSGLNPFGWAVWLGTVVLAGSTIAAVRGDVLPPLVISVGRPGVRTLFNASVLGLAILTTIGTFLWKIQSDAEYRPFSFTEFWMVPVTANDPDAFTVGVANQEAETRDFDIEVHVDDTIVAAWRAIRLEPGQTVTKIVGIPPGAVEERRVTAWLFESVDPSFIYRQTSAVVGGHAANFGSK